MAKPWSIAAQSFERPQIPQFGRDRSDVVRIEPPVAVGAGQTPQTLGARQRSPARHNGMEKSRTGVRGSSDFRSQEGWK